MSREISFNVHGVVYVSPDDPEHQDPLERHVRELVSLVEQIKDEQEYLVIRERVHRNTSESTNTRVKWWSVGQTILLVAVCLFQVFYLSTSHPSLTSFGITSSGDCPASSAKMYTDTGFDTQSDSSRSRRVYRRFSSYSTRFDNLSAHDRRVCSSARRATSLVSYGGPV